MILSALSPSGYCMLGKARVLGIYWENAWMWYDSPPLWPCNHSDHVCPSVLDIHVHSSQCNVDFI